MAALSTYLENELIDHVLRNLAYTSPTDVYVALFTDAASAAELEAGTLTNEVSGGSYARQLASFGAPADGLTDNTADLSFTDMPAVTVGYVAVMDAATTGNVLVHGALTTARTLSAGDTFTISTGDLDVTLA